MERKDIEKIEKIAKKWGVVFNRETTLHDELLKKLGSEPSLLRITDAQLKMIGYTTSIETTVDTSSRVDIIAERKLERLLVEVKGTDNPLVDQLIRYERDIKGRIYPSNQKVILVLPIWDGRNFEVWGINQLLIGIEKEDMATLERITEHYKKSADDMKDP